jgi:PLP dependent protein
MIYSQRLNLECFMSDIAANIETIQQRIHAAQKKFSRQGEPITLLAVSKKQSIEKIKKATDSGLYAFGENYVQEALPKIEALPTLQWHFIGAIQSNKCATIAEHFSWVHSVSSAVIAQRLNHARPATAAPLNICLQVNLESNSNKTGISADKVLKLAELVKTLPKLCLRGLMTLPEPTTHFEEQRKSFRQLARLLLDLRQAGLLVDTLSMGMSQDLEAAIAEGATILRVGTAIFGERI